MLPVFRCLRSDQAFEKNFKNEGGAGAIFFLQGSKDDALIVSEPAAAFPKRRKILNRIVVDE